MMTKEQKLYELSKELVYQMTGNYTEDTQNGDFQIAWTYLNKAMDFIQCCTQLKDKEALSFEEFKDEFYYKAQMGIYESKATGMFYNLTDLEKRYKKYCERF